MKNIGSKKTVFIGVLLVTNVICVGYIVAKDTPQFLRALWKSESARKKVSRKAQSDKVGSVEGPKFTRQTELQACYQAFLAREPQASSEGVIAVQWLVDDQGKVASIEVPRSDFEDSSLSECIQERIKSMDFPPAPTPDGQLMAHRFNFKKRALTSLDF